MKQTLKNPYLPEPAIIKKKVRHSPDNFSLYLDWHAHYSPGQFVQLSVLGIGESPISFASYGKDYVEFNIHEVGRVTHALAKMKKGDKVYIRGPFGRGYPLDLLHGNNLIFVGGGCGVAPLKGAIEYVEHHREKFRDVWLFMGFRSPDDVLFKNQLDAWKSSFIINTTVDQVKPQSCYAGHIGFITEEIRKTELSNANAVVFICGPPIMIKKTVEILVQKGFHDDQIFLSNERLMHCAIGKCGACMIRGKYTCIDGPVFRYDEIKDYKTD